MKNIKQVNSINFELNRDDLNEMIKDYFEKKMNLKLNLSSIKWDIIEKAVNTFYINNFETEDIMGFSHIFVKAKLE